MGQVQSQACRAQCGFNSIFLLPTNLYGPGDNLDRARSRVVPALIRKCVEAKEQGNREIVAWGDGSPTREFLYVEDASEGIALAAECAAPLAGTVDHLLCSIGNLAAKGQNHPSVVNWSISREHEHFVRQHLAQPIL